MPATQTSTVESIINDTLLQAESLVTKKLMPALNLIADVKNQLAHGTDLITTSQLQEWALVIPLIYEEIGSHKEAFALTKNLWDIEIKQTEAKNLLELDKKKTEIENINKVTGVDNAKKKALAEYLQHRIANTQESLNSLGNAVRKILDARIMGGKQE